MKTDFSSTIVAASHVANACLVMDFPVIVNYNCVDMTVEDNNKDNNPTFLTVNIGNILLSVMCGNNKISWHYFGKPTAADHNLLVVIRKYILEAALRPYLSQTDNTIKSSVTLFARAVREAFDMLVIELNGNYSDCKLTITDTSEIDRVPTKPVIQRIPSPKVTAKERVRHTDRERYKHRKALIRRINDCNDESFTLHGNLEAVSNRFGGIGGGTGTSSIVLAGCEYRLEEQGDTTILYTCPMSVTSILIDEGRC